MLPNLDYERRLQALERFMREIHGDRGATEVSTWTPTWTGLTVVGVPTYAGRYTHIGSLVFWKVTITAGGANTTASTLNTTYIDNPPITIAYNNPSLFVFDPTLGAALGQGICYVSGSGRLYTPTWTARNSSIEISGWYEI